MAVILIVEDEDLIREYAALMINDWGYATLSAGDVDMANALLHSAHRIDVLFTDIRLHKAVHGGFEIARKAVQLRPTLRVLYASGDVATSEITAMFVQGAHFLQKPYSCDKLQNSLGALLSA